MTFTISDLVQFLHLQFCKALWADIVFSFLNLSTVAKNIVYFLLFLAECCFEALHKAGKKKLSPQ